MGIPHLISTLEPYAQHVALERVNVVVDGPGLAHHILHVCRLNGVEHPSYRLLGETAVDWLDQLVFQRADINMIFFDGYLPKSKLPVRMQRAVKSTSQLASFYGYNGRGCPRCHIFEPAESVTIDPFKSGRLEIKPLEAPSFLVPAVIEGLQRSKRYKPIVKVVPGEADGYCAMAAADIGGVVITSDSDLLVHDLGAGGVVLLRDMYKDDEGVVCAAVYRTRDIFRALGLSGIADIRRFAYERLCSVHTSTTMLVRACSEPVKDEQAFKEFCAQYEEEERAVIPTFNLGDKLMLHGLDPRWSELLLQLSQSRSNTTPYAFRMFLPVLIDSTEKGTAWENSRGIRQLAYSLARNMLVPGSSGAVHEYRRVQTPDQSGRQVAMLSQSAIHTEVAHLAGTLNKLARSRSDKRDAMYWLLAYMTLDIHGSEADGRSPFAVDMLQRAEWPDDKTKTISWRFVHFVAQLQAAYYSLRMLKQIVHVSMLDAQRVAGSSFTKLAHALRKLPLLEESPNARSVCELLRTAPAAETGGILSQSFELPDPQAEYKIIPSKRCKKQKSDSAVSKKSTKGLATSNMFGLLPVE
ncbi:hypothetical protein CCM_00433 [Cordyceps militaris CM01]|uniref:Asteroid domain-containing protein n=1 Tax=Cordyceps militaris (strain CM01) TaxID=983644 RepID=G3J404_CORMM|nr:uncharacterized protein CCM_00433 [Cordyceps militaris CM01]EGX95779.1 hypothetical protein CCM_00433 [Cordyceps militaris CM01]